MSYASRIQEAQDLQRRVRKLRTELRICRSYVELIIKGTTIPTRELERLSERVHQALSPKKTRKKP